MTAREQLREQVERLSETEARVVLDVLAARRLEAFHAAASPDDEPEDDPADLDEARRDVANGQTVSLADARRELLG